MPGGATAPGAGDKAGRVFRPVTLSGIQPTGMPHLGNYIGALRNWVSLQDSAQPAQAAAAAAGTAAPPSPPSVLYMLADLHSLTVPQEPARLRASIRDLACALLACGIRPDASVLFRQSRVPQHAELGWLLFCRSPVSWVSRMHQWRAKLQLLSVPETALDGTADGRDAGLSDQDIGSIAETVAGSLNVGLLSYPILQAADILVYRATQVPVGEDQAQHLHLTSLIARSFNAHYGKQIFPVPQSLIPPTTGKRIMSLRVPTAKMSKSDPAEQSRINIDDSPDDIRSKIRRATTDSVRGVTYDPQSRPGVTNLLHIWMSLEPSGTKWESMSQEELAEQVSARFGAMSNQDFKNVVTDVVVGHLTPIRGEILRLRKDAAYVEKVLADGEAQAARLAERTMRDVRRAVGLA
ncbi:Tryptophan--tRNA ligase, mitochondrial [Polyrhizophydium stewartii]|uniref:tryptophan--tRNA ligase n=1 Tax=Polyrhizophydium stewartii TaxID=2732419 RepID=A0ABR4N2J7_9FUNG